jgi:dTDP-4-dehydrorhamnose 3,5-epimerase
MYMQSGYWSPDHERGIRRDDPSLAIPWPEPSPTLSRKDAEAPTLDTADLFW